MGTPHLDWVGFFTVLTIVPAVLVAAYLDARFALWREERRLCRSIARVAAGITPAPAGPEVDHVACGNPDCDQTICACRKPAECVGTTTVGCLHDWPWLCWECRLECTECALELHAEQAMDITHDEGGAW